jgi:glutamate/tyrosine decarboxylase-like PLP-dependent enzyme
MQTEFPDLNQTLDPNNTEEWEALRAQGHHMLDDIFNSLIQIPNQPVWQPIPLEKRKQFTQALPKNKNSLENAHTIFMQDILPYTSRNTHPGFMGWIQGGGTPIGMLADMLAAGLNANVGGRDQIPLEVERQVLQWMRELFSFPDTASGIFVSGASLANYMSILIARTACLGKEVRYTGLSHSSKKLIAYTSKGAHGCIAQGMDLAGLGINALRVIPMNADYQIDLTDLKHAIKEDREKGYTPFFIAATAGTVDVGAIDDLDAIATLAKEENLWFHVDGAYGALAMLSKEIAPRLKGIERADSLAFDFHKWAQVPYDAGFIMVRNGQLHYDTFAAPANYLRRESRGLSGGSPWPCDFGPDLSRGFRALKAWFTIQVYGQEQLGNIIFKTCCLAQYLKQKIQQEPRLELLAPVSLSIVCFRYKGENPDDLNANIVATLQEQGIAAPSMTTINQALAIRAAIINHRTTPQQIDAMLEAILKIGNELSRTSHSTSI